MVHKGKKTSSQERLHRQHRTRHIFSRAHVLRGARTVSKRLVKHYVPIPVRCVCVCVWVCWSGVIGRSANIRQVTQLSCDHPNLPPAGCVQYFYNADEDTGHVQSFNYDGGNGLHLANQNQQICIRYARAPASLVESGSGSTCRQHLLELLNETSFVAGVRGEIAGRCRELQVSFFVCDRYGSNCFCAVVLRQV